MVEQRGRHALIQGLAGGFVEEYSDDTMVSNLYRLDNVLWETKSPVFDVDGTKREAIPICPKHHLRMESIDHTNNNYYSAESAMHLRCVECDDDIKMFRSYREECQYVLDKIDSKKYKDMAVMNIDGESVPIAEATAVPEDKKHFVVARLMKSKVGLRLVVYAGEKGKKQKTQIFVEPDVKRISFDHNDIHPSEVFTKLEGEFVDGTKHKIQKRKKI